MQKPQPWFHSWYGDFFGIHSIPLIFALLAGLNLPPFSSPLSVIGTLITWILVIDWAHIFAQWHRIYGNPVESKTMKWVYPVSYFALIPVLTVLLHFTGRLPVETFLIYFVIYHFIKQNFGYIRIYAKTDGAKTKFEHYVETIFIYLSMFTPVVYWHISFPYERFLWAGYFIKSPVITYLFWPMLAMYALSAAGYFYIEAKRTKRNGQVNIPKNVAILAAAVGWGIVSVLSHSKFLIFFTVVLAHDVSYTCFVWLIGRRDKLITAKKIPWTSWWSVPGFIIYVLAIVIISQAILVIHHRLVGHNYPNIIFGNLFDGVKFQEGWLQNFGMALFFTTQAHHYFIDRYLWKKEKDLEYMVKTGKYSLS